MALNKRLISTAAAAGGADPFSSTAFYKFEQNADDSSGNGYNGTDLSASYTTGLFDSYSFDSNSSSQRIEIASLGTAFRNQTTFSVSTWFKTSGGTSLKSLFSFTDTTDGSTELNIWQRDSNGSGLQFLNRNNGTSVVSATLSTAINDNNWHHLVFVADGSNGTTFYIDGSVESATYSTGSSSTEVSMPNDLNMFLPGANIDSGGHQWHWVGQIDQMRIFNTAIDSDTVTALYNE